MFRKNLIPLLLDRPMTLAQIARFADEPISDAEDDLQHLLKSLKHTEFEPVISPAKCRKCGFAFSETKLSKPSKCPECLGTWLFEPKISLRKRDEPGQE